MSDFALEADLLNKNYRAICGVDEVGRGCLFGPVVAGAVILDPQQLHPEIDDSKRLGPGKRLRLAEFIYLHARAFSLGWSWNEEIDRHNILEATQKAMRQAVAHLQVRPDFILVDGIAAGFLPQPARAIPGGDRQSMSIAAASIIAKVFRDQLLVALAPHFPDYGLGKNKGYPTLQHRNMVLLKGVTLFHRQSFCT